MPTTPARRVAEILGRLTLAQDAAAVDALKARLCAPRRAVTLAFVNQHAINLAWDEAEFADNLLAADVLLRDGVGVKAALSALGRAPGLNLNGTDLIPDLLAAFRGRRVAVFGAAQPHLDIACARIQALFGVEIVCKRDGWARDTDYQDELRAHPADLVLLAMGMPKQERVARLLQKDEDARLIVCGGAIVDFLANKVTRAPVWMRRAGLEWAFRLAQEPQRLWARYGPGGVAFAWRVLVLKRRLKP